MLTIVVTLIGWYVVVGLAVATVIGLVYEDSYFRGRWFGTFERVTLFCEVTLLWPLAGTFAAADGYYWIKRKIVK